MASNSTLTVDEGVITVERTFDAPPELVWQAWTDPEHFKQWWGPKGFTSPSVEIDLRVGGKYLLCMTSPDGMNMYSTGVYSEITPHQRLVFTQSMADADGNPISPGIENFPLETEITVTLENLGGKTHMTMTQTGLPQSPQAQGAAAAWNQAFDKMAAILA